MSDPGAESESTSVERLWRIGNGHSAYHQF
jgi:hypothetical protein